MNTKDLVKRSVLLGLGAASLTKEKADRLVAEFVKRKLITVKDGRWVLRQVMKELAKNKERLERVSGLKAQALRKKAKSLERRLMKRGRRAAKGLISRAEKELQ